VPRASKYSWATCRYHHRPGVRDQLGHLVDVEDGHPHVDRVVTHVRHRREQELCGSLSTSAGRCSFGNPKPIKVPSRENAAYTIRLTRNFTRSPIRCSVVPGRLRATRRTWSTVTTIEESAKTACIAAEAGVDRGGAPNQDLDMAERVEAAIGAAVPLDVPLRTPSGRGRFTVTRYTSEGLVLLLGDQQAWTPLPWKALEEVPELLRGRGWVRIGSVYSMDSIAGTLDAHLKQYLARATAGWVAVVLEAAGVVHLDRTSPAKVKLSPNW
jgi:hypothetical protein